MSCTDFSSTSFCSVISNIAATYPSLSQNFLTWQINGYNHPIHGGCGWFQSRVAAWTTQLASTNSPGGKRRIQSKIDWANCMLNECCGQGGLVTYGCMDDGTKGNEYLNNQGTITNPQHGSVTPGTPALNYYPGATQDDGSCAYQPFITGCTDPTATNYDPTATMDCGNNTVSEFNIYYTNWQGHQPSGSWTPYGDTSCCTYVSPSPSTGIEYNWRFGKTGVNLNIGQHQTNNTMFDGGMFMPGGAYLNPGKRFGNQNDTTTNPLWVGLNPLSTQLIPNRQVTDPAVYNSASWYNIPIELFHLQTNMADGNISGNYPNEYHITVWDSQENLRGKWKYGLGSGPNIGAPSSGCGAISPCYRYWGFHFISHLAGDPQVVPQHGDFMKIEYWKEYPNDWSAWHAPTIQNWINNILVWNPPANQTPYTQAAFNAWSLPTTPFSNSADLVNYAGTGTDIRFNWMGQQGGQPIPFWKECIDSCTSPQLTNGNGCREWFPQRPPMLAPPFGAYPLAPPTQQGGPVDCCNGITMPMLGSSTAKLSSYELGGFCATNTVTTKSIYDKNENQTVEVTYEDTLGENDMLFNEEENDVQKISTFINNITPDSTKNIFNITFKTKDGYYYSKQPSVIMNFPGRENYNVNVESVYKNNNGYVTEKTFSISYKNTGFDVLEIDDHNIVFTNKINKKVTISKHKVIKAVSVDLIDIYSGMGLGRSKGVSIIGTPGSKFSMTVKDKNGTNMLTPLTTITKILKSAATTSNILELNNGAGLEEGMLVLNNQKRNVKITSILPNITTNVDKVGATSTTKVSISSFLTLSSDTPVTFAKNSELTDVEIPDNGAYSFNFNVPGLEKFSRTLKTGVDGSTSLTLDYTDDLEKNMRMSGTGVDGNNPTISEDIISDTDITVSTSQSITDETKLTFEVPENRYDITLHPLNATLGYDVPTYSSDDCDTLPTYCLYQYIDPVIEFTPSCSIANTTTTGTVSYKRGISDTRISISMTATRSDGSAFTKSRNPRFSSTNSTLSDFSNTTTRTTKRVREDGCTDTDNIHLNNTTDISVGMVVTGTNISDGPYKVTVKKITGSSVELSSKQTVNKNDNLTFSNEAGFSIINLEATLSTNAGTDNAICTVTGSGRITNFGIQSIASTFNFDNFISAS